MKVGSEYIDNGSSGFSTEMRKIKWFRLLGLACFGHCWVHLANAREPRFCGLHWGNEFEKSIGFKISASWLEERSVGPAC